MIKRFQVFAFVLPIFLLMSGCVQATEPAAGDQVMCTQEAKMCPDGSFVGRTGPKCEFSPCPEPVAACTKEAKICADGTAVGREGPKCEFAPCPSEKPAE